MPEYIGFVIVLFVLSLICERLADFLKNYLSECNDGWGRAIGKFLKIGDLLTKKPADSPEENKRYYRILKINILCGFFTAWALHADLFTIIENKDKPFDALGWSDSTFFWQAGFDWNDGKVFIDALVFLVGCLATGFFISFGSKFWHDMLDILFQIKNYKRVLADSETYKLDNIKSVDTALSTFQSDFITAAYLEARPTYMAMPNVRGMSLKSDRNGYYFDIRTYRPGSEIPDKYVYMLDNKTPQSIRIKLSVMASDITKSQVFDLSDEIFATGKAKSSGTFGCLVKSKKAGTATYLLTCSHNLFQPVSAVKDFKTNPPVQAESSPKKPTAIGKVVDAVFDHDADVALIEINPTALEQIDNRVPGVGRPGQIRQVVKDDIDKVQVFLYGAVSGSKDGMITGVYASEKIDYSGVSYELQNLIIISKNSFAITDKGDSGSLVLDDKQGVIGLVVAGNSRETFVLPMNILALKMEVDLV